MPTDPPASRAQSFQESLLRLMAELLERESHSTMYQRVLEEAVAIIPGAQAGSVTLLGDDGRFRFVAAVGYELERLAHVSFGYDEATFALQEVGDSQLVPDLDRYDRETLDVERYALLRDAGRVEDIEVTMMVPIRFGRRLVATLLVDNFEREDAFGAEARRMAEIFGANIGVVLQRLRMEEELRRSEAQFVRLFQESPAPTALLDLDTLSIDDVNRSLALLLGHPRGSLLGRRFDDRSLMEDPEPFLAAVRAARRDGGAQEVELRLRTATGGVRWCLTGLQPAGAADRRYLVCTFLDITDRRRTEEQLMSAIKAVLEDASWFSSSVMEKLAQLRGEEEVSRIGELTPRERQVLSLIAAGRSNADIAASLELSPQTVRNYAARVYQKLGVHTRAEAVVWARERGLVAE